MSALPPQLWFSSFRSPAVPTKIWLGAAAVGVIGLGGVATYRSFSGSSLQCQDERKFPRVKKDRGEGATSFFDKLELPSVELPSLSKLPGLPQLPNLPSFGALSEKLNSFQATFITLHAEITHSPESVTARVLSEATDVERHPEMQWDATVRLGSSLPSAERAFVRNRREGMRVKFAKLMGVDESEVNERDVPVVAIAGSGGGYRAMVNTLGAISGAQETGIWDVVTYASAVSGSCWALSMLYGIGEGSVEKTIEHVKRRIQVPFLDPTSLELMTSESTSEYLLSGSILKNDSKGSDFSLVDLYGTLVSTRLFVPSDLTTLSSSNLKVSSQRKFVDMGQQPLPIYCLIRHEIPHEDELRKAVKAHKDAEASDMMKRSKWMWFELTPYEFGCDEIGAFIPTWSLGRAFNHGTNIERRPELDLTILSGIFASAFCATLFSYFKEVRPLLSTLPYFKPLEKWLVTNYETSLDAIHPFPPAELPNFLKGLDGQLSSTTPEAITKLETLGFMDAGANLNVPYVPLFRRDCDLIIAFDASADSQELWFSRAEEYATERQLHTWPRIRSKSLFRELVSGASESKESSPAPSDLAASKVDAAKTQEQESHLNPPATDGKAQPTEINPQRVPEGSAPSSVQAKKAGGSIPEGVAGGGQGEEEGELPLGRCNIWIGSTNTEGTTCRNDNPTVEDVVARDGIALAYYPLVPGPELGNPSAVWSTWKFEYTEEETQSLVNLAKANFRSGEEQLKTTLMGIWLRKRAQRLGAEEAETNAN